MLSVPGCNHEICNRADGSDMSVEDVNFVLNCLLEQGVVEVLYDVEANKFKYRMAEEYKAGR